MSSHPETNLNEVIDRLRAEMAIDKELLAQLNLVLRMDPEFDGLSLVGGMKSLLRRYQELKSENITLKSRTR